MSSGRLNLAEIEALLLPLHNVERLIKFLAAARRENARRVKRYMCAAVGMAKPQSRNSTCWKAHSYLQRSDLAHHLAALRPVKVICRFDNFLSGRLGARLVPKTAAYRVAPSCGSVLEHHLVQRYQPGISELCKVGREHSVVVGYELFHAGSDIFAPQASV
jgi:hypothetical protein